MNEDTKASLCKYLTTLTGSVLAGLCEPAEMSKCGKHTCE
jgi:hypothetical protein